MRLYQMCFLFPFMSLSLYAQIDKSCTDELDNFCYNKLPQEKLVHCYFKNKIRLTKKCQKIVSDVYTDPKITKSDMTLQKEIQQ